MLHRRVVGRGEHETDAGLPRASMADLKGADPAYNASRLRGLLEGVKDPYRDIVLLNAAATGSTHFLS